jgi:acetyl-CoA carboxylase biotin carboxyl carrier protein
VTEPVDPRSRTELRALLRAIEDGGWEYARVEIDGVTLTVSSDADFVALEAATSPTSTTSTPPTTPAVDTVPVEPDTPVASGPTEAESAPDGGPQSGPAAPRSADAHKVTAPSIGLFWRSPKPGAPPFVEVGDRVGAEDTVCIIEVMKLMTHVSAGVAGVVRAIHVSNGDMVEHGTALLDIEPKASA